MPGQRNATAASAPPHPPHPHGQRCDDRAGDERERRTAALLARAATCDGAQRQQLRDEVVLLNGPVAEAIAHRYRARGIDADDLVQVAYLGLVKATRGYRVGEGPSFLAYAVPTISGEVKRHFRDFSWMVRPPRRIQELRSAVMWATSEHVQEQGRAPTHAELAGLLGVAENELAEAARADRCFTALSLEDPGAAGNAPVPTDLLADGADDFARVEDVAFLQPALRSLCERDRRILALRFVAGCTQEEIGTQIGVSQMQVSRLLTRILRDLRRELSTEEHEPVADGDGSAR